ncbi:MAG: NADH-quinone oxidoreductase subunit L [Candidatus Omnitrophota bacterium]|nr:NADH-quinone oxidoreductase subunit L [Candidatus Omnitrophota bacterium]
MVKYAHLIPLFPFLAFAINILFGRKLKRSSAIISVAASSISLFLAALTFLGNLKGEGSYVIAKWLSFNGIPLNFGVTVDPLSCMMLLVVTIVGTLIQVYSIGYMGEDKRFSRFFAYMSLFMGSMLGLVLADNFVILYIFWEGVGLCSYFLISFWFERPAAAKAGMKAFITTRIGDTGLLIGILLLFFTTKTLYFKDLSGLSGDNTIFTIAALLIFCGAIGKSAQFPLHVWLPDAMEGPTPVSALIHAATMVAAGVYLVARAYGIFVMNQIPLIAVAYIGAITALMAASIALVNNDIKRILAYSTISQLGLMMVGLGAGAYSAGTFHLMTHAFFKALLFLCAGSVIHSIHIQDIQKMGGLFNKMKVTGTTFIIAGLAIAGVPPLAGFWSKDEILSELLKSGHPALFAIALATSLMTAFYMFRLIFLVLFGKPRSELHAHESPNVMTIPLSILAVFSIFIGFIGSPFMNHAFQNFIYFGDVHTMEVIEPNYFAMGLSTAVGLFGIGLAYLFYILNNKILSQTIRAKFSLLYDVLSNKYYSDEIYEFLFIKPCLRLADLSFKFDLGVIDGAVNGAARVTMAISRVKSWIDIHVVDFFVNLVAVLTGFTSLAVRRIHTGRVQNYLLIAFFGLVLIIVIKLIGG